MDELGGLLINRRMYSFQSDESDMQLYGTREQFGLEKELISFQDKI